MCLLKAVCKDIKYSFVSQGICGVMWCIQLNNKIDDRLSICIK